MSHGQITHYSEAHHRITAHIRTELLKPEPIHAAWTNFSSQQSVRGIALAPKLHRVWIATWGGVLVLDREENLLYQRFSSEHGLAGNAVACICVDREEHPWTGHVEGGISYFDGNHWQIYGYLQHETIRAISSAIYSGGIWAASIDMVYYIAGIDHPPEPVASERHDGTVEALALLDTGSDLLLGNAWGLYRLSLDEEPIRLRENTCTALAQGRTGDVWVGTDEGIYRLDNQVPVDPITFADDTQQSERILGLAAGRDQLWVLTTAGLGKIVGEHWQPIPGPKEPTTLYTIAADPHESYLWVGTDRLLAGVHCQEHMDPFWDFDWLPVEKEETLNNIGRCVASSMLNDRVWIGTAGGLISFSSDNEWTTYPESGDVQSLCIANGGMASLSQKILWVVAQPQGLGRWAYPNWLDFRGTPLPGLPIVCAIGQEGDLYLLTSRGLWHVADKVLVGAIAPPAVRCLAQTVDGEWWLGTLHGIYRLVSGGWQIAGEQPAFRVSIRALAVIDNMLWAATAKGLWIRQGGKWEQCCAEQDDPLSDVRTLAPAYNTGKLWLARENGVVLYDPVSGRQISSYTPINSGLGSYRIVAISEIDRTLWVITQAGISRFQLD